MRLVRLTLRPLAVAAMLALAAALAPSVLALDPSWKVSQFHRESWTRRNGLPQNSVLAIELSRDGYLWLGTQEGLARFDGVEFETFSAGQFPALGHNFISALHQDAAGRLWIGTEPGRLAVLDGDDPRAIRCAEAYDRIHAILSDADGGIWVAAGASGLLRIDETGTLSPVLDATGRRSGPVLALLSLASGRLIAGGNGELLELAGGSFTRRPLSPRLEGTVSALAADAAGRLWISTPGGTLAAAAPGSLASGTHEAPDESAHEIEVEPLPFRLDGETLALAFDRQDTLWIATETGLSRLLPGSHGRPETFGARQTGKTNALLVDDEDNLWVGSHDAGLVRFSNAEVEPFGKAEGLPDDSAWNVLESRDGGVWVTTDEGIGRLSSSGVEEIDLDGLPDEDTTALAETSDGALWLGTYRHGVYRLDRATSELRHLDERDGIPPGVVTLLFEDSAGTLWVGTRMGLARGDGKVFRPVRLRSEAVQPYVSAALEDHDGTVWVATYAGLFAFRGERMERWTQKDGLRSESLNALHLDENGTLWIATNGEGLIRFKGGSFARLAEPQGMPFGLLIWILEDELDRLWISTNHGVVVAHRAELERVADGRAPRVFVRVIDEGDGMRDAECSGTGQPAAARTRDGQLWFPTTLGLAAIRPSRVQEPAPPAAGVTRILRGTTRHPSSGDGEPIRLAPSRGALELHFTAHGWDEPAATTFRYRLAGYDAEWVETGTRRVALFTNLWPRDYRFEVQARHADGGAWGPTAVQALELLPHVYQQTWFFAGAALIAGAGIAALVRWRGRRLEGVVRERTRELALVNTRLQEAIAREAAARTQAEAHEAEALRASAAKADFLATVSHELRTPLNAVLGMTGLLVETPLTREQREWVEITRSSGSSLLILVNQILEFSRIERGGLELEAEPFSLVDCLEGTLDLVANAAGEKGLDLAAWADAESFRMVVGDGARLRQVALNLLSNAIKFSERGGVLVALTSRDTLDGVEVVLAVSDTGIGIPDDRRDRLFQPFRQIDTSHGRRFGGSGLGLAISSRLCAQMGGGIEVDSMPNRGTTFHARVVLGRHQEEPGWERGRPLSGHRAVMMGFSDQSQTALAAQLRALGAELVPGPPDRELLQSLSEGDLMLAAPGLSRQEAARGSLARWIPLEPPCGSTEARRAVRPARVATALRKALEVPRPTEHPPQSTGTPTPPKAPLSVLVVEDNATNQRVVQAMLHRLGHRSVAAGDGPEALSLLEGQSFDVVLLDIQMPGMDGFTVAREIRARLGPKAPQLVALTASAFDGDRERGFAAGMSDYLTKPVWPDQLTAALERARRRPNGGEAVSA